MRAGTFSSSNAWKLMTNGKSKDHIGAPGLKYIKQVMYEQLLGRAINAERDTRPTTWGTFVEKRAFDLLPIAYKHITNQRWYHPTLPHSGAPDLLIGTNIVSDLKSPYSLEVFCDKIEVLSQGDIELYKSEYPEDYWQHISNAVLLDLNGLSIDKLEAIIYCPYKSELDEIRSMANNYGEHDQYRFKWIGFAMDEEMPYLNDGGNHRNLNVFQFDIPKEDKLAFVNRLELASCKLNEMKPKLIAA